MSALYCVICFSFREERKMFKDISFGKAICGMAICLLLAGYVECHDLWNQPQDTTLCVQRLKEALYAKQDNKGVAFRYAIINAE